MPTPRSVLSTLTWVLPAAFLAATGVAKILGPQGTAPEALRGLTQVAGWSTWLRAMGVLETLVAAALVWPRTRAFGRGAAFVLVGALTLLVVLNAHDEHFVSDCGCMGAMGSRRPQSHELELLVLRNVTLLTVLLLGGRLARPEVPAGSALRSAGVLGAVLLLAALFAAEKMRAEDLREAREAIDQGQTLASRLGGLLPELTVHDEQGQALSLRAAVRPGDHLLVLSTTCPHCAILGAEVQALAARVGGQGRRLVLLVIEEGGGTAEAWTGEHGMAGLPRLALARRRDGRRLGVEGVPSLLILGPDARIAAHEEHGGFPSLVGALDSLAGLLPTLAGAVWAALAQRVAGEQATAGTPERQPDGSWASPLTLPGGATGRLLVRTGGQRRAHALELAIGLGPDGRLLGLVPLALGSHTALVKPELEAALAPLAGLTVAEAREKVRELSRDGLLLPGPLRSVFTLLERLGAP